MSIEIPEDRPTMAPQGQGHVFLTPSASRCGTSHVTVVLENSKVICSCEGFQFRHSCWHAAALTDVEGDDFELSL